MPQEVELSTQLLYLGGIFAACWLPALLFSKRVAAHFFVLSFLCIGVGVTGPSAAGGIPVIVLLVVAFLVALNLLRIVLALFIGRGAADTAVGSLLATMITIAVLPRRLFTLLRQWFNEHTR